MSVRSIILMLGLALAAQPAQAQTYSLAEPLLDNACFRLEMSLELKGKITVQQDGKPASYPHGAQARHEFVERILNANGPLASKSARYYHKAEASLTTDKEAVVKKFRPDRKLLAAQRLKDQTHVYSPKGPLTQDELELTEHFDTLCLAGILPGKDVAVGDSWKIDSAVVQALCDFEGLVEHDLTGKLEKVAGDRAQIVLIGKAKDIDMGAEVNLLVKATAQFDLKEKRLVALEWTQDDQRQQGPVNPKLSAEVKITLTRTPIEEPSDLNNFALVPFPNDPAPPENLLAIQHKDARNRFRFQYGRDWHLVGVKDEQLVLRLMDRGHFVAQATVTPWKKADKMMSVDDFKELMEKAPGWEQEQVVERKDKIDAPYGHRVYRVTALGELEGVKAMQVFYLVNSPQGDQAIVTFTLTPNQVEQLSSRDFPLVRSLILPGSDVPAGTKDE
jgi:hypothetical protein